MDIENIKRWHWGAIGLIVGVLLAGSKMFYGVDYDGHSLDKSFDIIAYGSAETPVPVGFFSGRWCYLSDVIVHPPVPADERVDGSGKDGLAPGTMIHWVTGKLHEMKMTSKRDASGKLVFENVTVTKFFHRSPSPYKVGGSSFADVQSFLASVTTQTNGRSGHFRFAWWEKPAAVWSFYPLGGLVLIGGVWPTLLGLMRGMGLGRQKAAEPGVDLRHYKSTTKAAMPQGATGLTEADRERLDAMTAAMEEDLAGAVTSHSAGGAAREETVVRELDTTSSAPVAPAPPRPAKTFGSGAFYPTEIHRPHDDGEKGK